MLSQEQQIRERILEASAHLAGTLLRCHWYSWSTQRWRVSCRIRGPLTVSNLPERIDSVSYLLDRSLGHCYSKVLVLSFGDQVLPGAMASWPGRAADGGQCLPCSVLPTLCAGGNGAWRVVPWLSLSPKSTGWGQSPGLFWGT